MSLRSFKLLVTSTDQAALGLLGRRYPGTSSVELIQGTVQVASAVLQLCSSLRLADRCSGADDLRTMRQLVDDDPALGHDVRSQLSLATRPYP